MNYFFKKYFLFCVPFTCIVKKHSTMSQQSSNKAVVKTIITTTKIDKNGKKVVTQEVVEKGFVLKSPDFLVKNFFKHTEKNL